MGEVIIFAFVNLLSFFCRNILQEWVVWPASLIHERLAFWKRSSGGFDGIRIGGNIR